MDPRLPDRDLRVSDAEREHVAQLLERATGRGLIDLDEFTARVDVALRARTRGELNAVLTDLPGLSHPDRPATATPAPRRTAVPARPGVAGDRTVLSTAFGSVSRRGGWEVPQRLAVRNAMGSTDLDFTDADLPADGVDISLDVTAGSVELRVPDGARVEHDGVQVILGSFDDRRRRGQGRPDGARFVLSGTVRIGSVEIRGPHRARFWQRG